MGRPLSTYVVLTFLISGLELCACYSSFDFEGTCIFPEGAPVGMSTWLCFQMAFALLSFVFAPYVQMKVWKRLTEEVKDNLPSVDGKIRVPKKDVQASFKHVFLMDIGVLFFFFAMLGSLAWSWLGMKWIRVTQCAAGSMELSSWLGSATFWIAAFYASAWYCCACCARSVDLDDQESSGSDSESARD